MGGFNHSAVAGLAASPGGDGAEMLGGVGSIPARGLPVTRPWLRRCHPEHGEDKGALPGKLCWGLKSFLQLREKPESLILCHCG